MIGTPLQAAVVALHMRDKDEFVITKDATKPVLDTIRAHVDALKTTGETSTWNGGGQRLQYARRLEESLRRWSAQFPFHHVTGNLPGGRRTEKSWSDRAIEVMDRLGVARDGSVFDTQIDNADAVIRIDLSGASSDVATNAEESPVEMEGA